MRASWTIRAVLVLGFSALAATACVDSKSDTGVDNTHGTGSGPPRSVDLGKCPELGLEGAAEMPLQTVRIEPLSFTMGDSTDTNASPTHPVTLDTAFEMTLTEVTQGQWMTLGFPNPSQNAACADCPVEQVTWHEAAAFAEAKSAADGLGSCYTCTGSGSATTCTAPADPYTCEGWRLPTEAEWEAAAAADGLSWAGSEDYTLVAWSVEAVGRPCPVGTLASTTSGLYDLSGNVSEWVHDGFEPYSEADATNPVGADSSTRVVRGGSIFQLAAEAKVTVREAQDAGEAVPWRGFRLVKSAGALVDDTTE
jgi:formylglycine-generating enzyme required for sulfatase activity